MTRDCSCTIDLAFPKPYCEFCTVDSSIWILFYCGLAAYRQTFHMARIVVCTRFGLDACVQKNEPLRKLQGWSPTILTHSTCVSIWPKAFDLELPLPKAVASVKLVFIGVPAVSEKLPAPIHDYCPLVSGSRTCPNFAAFLFRWPISAFYQQYKNLQTKWKKNQPACDGLANFRYYSGLRGIQIAKLFRHRFATGSPLILN